MKKFSKLLTIILTIALLATNANVINADEVLVGSIEVINGTRSTDDPGHHEEIVPQADVEFYTNVYTTLGFLQPYDGYTKKPIVKRDGKQINVTVDGTSYLSDDWDVTYYKAGQLVSYPNGWLRISGYPTASASFTVEFQPIDYKIAFNSNGGEGNMDTIDAVYDETIVLPENTFTKEGYIFTGWNTMADGNGDSYEDKGDVLSLTTTQDETITLYAQWAEAHELTIHWSSLDQLDLMEPVVVEYAEGMRYFEVIDEVFEKEGYFPAYAITNKPITEYNDFDELYEDDLINSEIDPDISDVYYIMQIVIDEVNVKVTPPTPESTTDTPEYEYGDWDFLNQTNAPIISTDIETELEVAAWVESFDNEVTNPYIGEFVPKEKYKAVYFVLPKFGYVFGEEVKYNVEGATLVLEDYIILYLEVEIDDILYDDDKDDDYIYEWQKGSNKTLDIRFVRNYNDELTFSKLEAVDVDGNEIAADKYDKENGSVIIKLKPDYLETLSVGEHTLTAKFENNRSASVKFEIQEKDKTPTPTPNHIVPNTGVR